MKKQIDDRASLKEMEAVIVSFQASGLTQPEFCEQQQIKLWQSHALTWAKLNSILKDISKPESEKKFFRSRREMSGKKMVRFRWGQFDKKTICVFA